MPAWLPIVIGLVALAVLSGGWYFRRYQMTLPPAGIVNLRDVAVMLLGISLLPYLYLALPAAGAAMVFGAAVLGILYFTLEPVLRARWAVWAGSLLLVAGDITLALAAGVASAPFLLLNGAVLVLAVTGVSNLWAQSGMKARDVAVLAGALAVYDWVATVRLTVTEDLIGRLAGLPFVPLLAWHADAPARGLVGVGLGDLLLATLFTLVMRKAFGSAAGRLAAAVSLATIAVVLALLAAGAITTAVPAMVFLGPLMVAQYLGWRRAWGQERTTGQYLQAEPLPGGVNAARGGDPD
ncbi:MAG TPA: hypothetical protein VE776_08695 [Actinomycetota bacterium]|jgi:hypothetical protein|nr:hypothetical protein [Actinomycetota bacterium]